MSVDNDSDLDRYVRAVLEKKAQGVSVLDVSPLTAMADIFIICSGRSNRQVTAIAEHIRAALKEQGIRPLSLEGLKEGHWVLMDYGHIIIHVFYEPVRAFYDLDGLWSDARRISTPSLAEWARRTPADGESLSEVDGDD